MAIVDTSFLVALFFQTDKFHGQAQAIVLAGDRFLVPREVWAEYVDVVMRLAPPDLVARILESTLQGPFSIQEVGRPEDAPEVARRVAGFRPKLAQLGSRPLSFFDLVVCLAAARFRESVLTFDGGMARAIEAKIFPGARLH